MNVKRSAWLGAGGLLVFWAGWLVQAGTAREPLVLLTGKSAFASYLNERPGTFRRLTANDLPEPNAVQSVANAAKLVPRPEGAWPQAPEGFKVELYASQLSGPRQIRRAPNGDMFVAESSKGEIEIFRGITADGTSKMKFTFAAGLKGPFGIAFFPVGKTPQYVYIGTKHSVVRFAYSNGDVQASGPPETVIADIPSQGHWTRDLAFSRDGSILFVAIGSYSNVEEKPEMVAKEIRRANILEYTPEGKFLSVYASGIRNPVGIAIHPVTGELWCSVNERDLLGDNLVPDYITHVREGEFFGWPWFYIGDHQDPRHPGSHPELKGTITIPDVLLQPHNASLGMTFYDGKQFPKEYRDDIFAAEHGSWNKSVRTGYEVIRVPLKHGKASGIYEDLLTGFVTADGNVWGRPVGVATASDGSLLVTDDGSNSIWRLTYSH